MWVLILLMWFHFLIQDGKFFDLICKFLLVDILAALQTEGPTNGLAHDLNLFEISLL